MSGKPTVAAFRPDDGRLAGAMERLRDLGADPVGDAMLAVESTGATPAPGDRVVFTSRTGAELVDEVGWTPEGETVCAIGPKTAEALRERGYAVDVVPEEYSSAGLVAALRDGVAGERVTVARSDHGSDVLLDGLREAGADVTETVLYRLVRPGGSGHSTELAAAGDLDGACFTSSLTVEHFRDAAVERGVWDAARRELGDGVVGCIGEPTRQAASEVGLAVDVVPDTASFEALSRAVVDRTQKRN